MKPFLSVLLLVLLTGCGGGGGGGTSATSGPTASTLNFPLRQAVNALTANGESVTLTAIGTNATQAVNGWCSGTYTTISAPTTGGATFQGQAALSSVTTSTLNFTNCTPSTITGSGTSYYDTNYVPLGEVNAAGPMSLWQASPTIPTTVRVGDTITIGTKNHFTDISGTVADGHTDITVVVEADTSTTAILNQIHTGYNAAGLLTNTTQSRFRIDALGNLTRTSVDIQYSNISTLHLVFRQ